MVIFRVVLRETNPTNRTEASWKLLEKAVAGGAETPRRSGAGLQGQGWCCGCRCSAPPAGARSSWPPKSRGGAALLHRSAGTALPGRRAGARRQIRPAVRPASPLRPWGRARRAPHRTPGPGPVLAGQPLEAPRCALLQPRGGARLRPLLSGDTAPARPQHRLLGAPGASQCVAGAMLG